MLNRSSSRVFSPYTEICLIGSRRRNNFPAPWNFLHLATQHGAGLHRPMNNPPRRHDTFIISGSTLPLIKNSLRLTSGMSRRPPTGKSGGRSTRPGLALCDSHNVATARLMEKDNKKARDGARKEYNETVKVRLAGARSHFNDRTPVGSRYVRA